MRSASLLIAGLVALASADCMSNFDGTFDITVVQPADFSKRAFEAHDCAEPDTLVMTLKSGILVDARNRTGSIVSNDQFQFDGPVQNNAKATSGFSICNDAYLAFNGSTDFWSCDSGDFSNLYDKKVAPQCMRVNLLIASCDPDNGVAPCNYAPVTQISDGQIQAPTAVPPPPAVPDTPASPAATSAPTTQAPQPTGVMGSGDSSPEAGPAAPPIPTGGIPTSGALMAIVDAKAALAVALVALFAL